MRYLIKFSYDGTNFNGYQKQPGHRCVESELEKALFDINDHKKTKVVGAGRTDRGVHANCQCAHFDLDIDITLYKLKCALNSLLPPDIHVFEVSDVNQAKSILDYSLNYEGPIYIRCGVEPTENIYNEKICSVLYIAFVHWLCQCTSC